MALKLRTALDGAWVPVAAAVGGNQLAVTELRVACLIIESDSYRIVDRRAQVVDRGELHLGDECSPQALDIVGVEGPNAGKRMLAIIELQDDRLLVCYDLEQSRRPVSMQAQGEQLLLCITYARAATRLSS